MSTPTYTADEFRTARFAEHVRIGLAVRQSIDPEYKWTSHDGGCYTDQDMAEMGWTPVYEADREPVEKARRAAQTLGKVVDDQCTDVLHATRMYDQVDEDGDGDWQVIWERMADLCDKGRKWEDARHLTLDALRTAWQNAEVPTENTPIREGDVLISPNGLDTGFIVRLPSGVDGMDDGFRVLSRAPQREPWQDLADVLERVWPSGINGANNEGVARVLHIEGLRKTDGDDDA